MYAVFPQGIVIAWLVISALIVLSALHSFRPSRHKHFFILSFFITWLMMELAGHLLLVLLVGGIAVWVCGDLSHPLTLATLATDALGILLFAGHLYNAHKAKGAMAEALSSYIPPAPPNRVPRTKLLYPFHPHRKGTRRTRDIVFARAGGRILKMDVFSPAAAPQDGRRYPAVIQIHGGGWVLGSKNEQGLPLLNHLAANGWVGFNVNYRLSPAATWPEHLIDIKRALAYIRAHADEYHIDPDFIAVTGGSAGGHLCAMMELTAGDPRYQPGFEDADTSLQAAVPFYGIYDFTDKLRLLGKPFVETLLERMIMKAFLSEEPEKFEAASPLSLVHADAPPTLIIHGSRDVLAPVQYARLYAKELKETSRNPVFYAEIPCAQHAFEIFASPRTLHVIEGVERFLDAAYQGRSDANYNSPFAHARIEEDSGLPVA